MVNKTLNLKVAEAIQNDVGRGIVRLDSKAKRELNLSTGDFVKLSGKKSTIAIVWQSQPDDEGLETARMDGILRQNAGVGLGDRVKIERVEVKNAKKVVLSPKEPMRSSPGFDQYVKRKLIGKGVLKGNTLPLGIFGTAIPLVVSQLVPQSPVVITEATEVVIRNEPVKEADSIPSVTYDDIGGLQSAIQKIREMVQLPLTHPELFERLGIEPPKGVMLYGPPGTGKTLLAKAVANESDANFFHIGGPEVVSKFVGESEEKIRKIFKDAEENAPSIIFIDEVDAIAPKRGEVTGEVERRMVSQLLTLLDGLKSRGQVIVIAATNRPDSIDEALRRPGRFDREIEIGVPDKKGRGEILQIHTRNMPISHYDGEVAAEKVLGLFSKFTEKSESGESGLSARINEAVEEKQSGLDRQIAAREREIAGTGEALARVQSELDEAKRRLQEYESSKPVSKKDAEVISAIIEKGRQALDTITKERERIEREAADKQAELDELEGKRSRFEKSKKELMQERKGLEKAGAAFVAAQENGGIAGKLAKGIEELKKTDEAYWLRIHEKDFVRASLIGVAKGMEEKEVSKYVQEILGLEFLGEKVVSDSELANMMHEVASESSAKLVEHFAAVTHGYTGADLSLLVKEAALKALRRMLPEIDLDEEAIKPEVLEKLVVIDDDFSSGMREIHPSALREIYVERPSVKWDRVGGLEAIKDEIRESVELPLKTPEVFERMGIRPIKGILLYGPPGTGKTLLAKAVATESEANFIAISGPSILSKWVGESEKALREIFKKARQAAPAIVFIDELDSIAPRRGGSGDAGNMVTERIVDTLLTEMDGLLSLKNVVVIGATNRPDILDVALLRAGRFDKIIEIPLPDKQARLEILKIHTSRMPLEDVDLRKFAELTEGLSGADIENLVREAGMIAIREKSEKVNAEHFGKALTSIIPSVRKDHVESMKKFKGGGGQRMYG